MNDLNLDREMPDIPMSVFSLSLDDPDLTYHMRCAELWDEILVEVLDPEYTRRNHSSTGTYDQGCRGPLSRKALREHPRRKSPSPVELVVHEDRVYDPVLEYFYTIIKYRVKNLQRQIMKELNTA